MDSTLWTQFIAASWLTKIATGVVLISASVLLAFVFYKLYEGAFSSKGAQVSKGPLESFKRWWNRATLIQALEQKTTVLQAEQEKIGIKLEQDKAESTLHSNRLEAKIEALNGQLEDAFSEISALKEDVRGLKGHIPLMENIKEFLKKNASTTEAYTQSEKAQAEAKKAADVVQFAYTAEQAAARKVLGSPSQAAEMTPKKRRWF